MMLLGPPPGLVTVSEALVGTLGRYHRRSLRDQIQRPLIHRMPSRWTGYEALVAADTQARRMPP